MIHICSAPEVTFFPNPLWCRCGLLDKLLEWSRIFLPAPTCLVTLRRKLLRLWDGSNQVLCMPPIAGFDWFPACFCLLLKLYPGYLILKFREDYNP
jgi:hypothetical protein